MFIVDGLKPPTVLGNNGKIWAQMKIWGIFLCLKMGAASRKCGFRLVSIKVFGTEPRKDLGAAEFPALFVLSQNYKTEPGQPGTLAKFGELKQQKWCKTLVLTSKDGGLSSKKGGFKDKIWFNEQTWNGGLTDQTWWFNHFDQQNDINYTGDWGVFETIWSHQWLKYEELEIESWETCGKYGWTLVNLGEW